MILLHNNLATLAKIAGDIRARYSMQGVRVAETKTGYRVEATDGRRLVRVDGDNVGLPEDYPNIPALAGAPNGATSAVVSAKEWIKAMKDAPKKDIKPILNAVACVLAKDVTTLATTDLDSNLVRQPRNVDGLYPDTDAVLKDATKTAPVVSIDVNPKYLAELLTVALAFCAKDTARVTLELRKDGKPVVVRCANETQKFTGLLMPLT